MNKTCKLLVAIVGRPNVGKSAIFNRMIGKRISIVEDVPYVTRDRIYSDLIWNGFEFSLVDTGGIDPGAEDSFRTAVLQQTSRAIDEADLLLFTVDQVDGLTALDIDVAELLRKSRKPVILVANKGETKREGLHDFYEIGFGEPFSISAIHGTNCAELLDIIVEQLKSMKIEETEETPESSDSIQVALLGRPNVGKSSILNFVSGDTRSVVHEKPGTTRDAIDIVIEYKNKKIVLVDTAGLRRKGKVSEKVEYFSTVRTRKVLSRCHIAVQVLDASDGLIMGDKKIAGEIKDYFRASIILVNKWDMVEESPVIRGRYTLLQQKFLGLLGGELNFLGYAPVLFSSALKGWGLDGLLDLTLEVGDEFRKEIPDKILHRILSDAVFMNPPPSADSGKPVKITQISQVGIEPPTILLRTSEPHCISETYLRYIENKIRTEFKLVGTPIKFIIRRS